MKYKKIQTEIAPDQYASMKALMSHGNSMGQVARHQIDKELHTMATEINRAVPMYEDDGN